MLLYVLELQYTEPWCNLHFYFLVNIRNNCLIITLDKKIIPLKLCTAFVTCIAPWIENRPKLRKDTV